MKHTQRLTLQLLRQKSLQKASRVAIKHMSDLTSADFGSLFLLKANNLERIYSNIPLSLQLKPRKNGRTRKSIDTGRIILISQKQLQSSHPKVSSKIRNVLVIPLIYQDKTLGAITLESLSPIKLTPHIKSRLKIYIPIITLTIRNLQLVEDLKTSLQSKQMFMSTAAHELKTPLGVIFAYIQLIKKNHISNKKINIKWINSIITNSKRLEYLISNLFTASKMISGSFEFQTKKLNLGTLVKKTSTELALLHERNINLHVANQPLYVDADSTMITMVLINLLNNAIKHTHSSKQVSVKLAKYKQFARITISDQGEGIKPQEIKKVFESYYRGENKKSSGLGLGLYLCQQIIRGHGGIIQLESKLNKGTKVTIHLELIE